MKAVGCVELTVRRFHATRSFFAFIHSTTTTTPIGLRPATCADDAAHHKFFASALGGFKFSHFRRKARRRGGPQLDRPHPLNGRHRAITLIKLTLCSHVPLTNR